MICRTSIITLFGALILVGCNDSASDIPEVPKLPSLEDIQAITTSECLCQMAGFESSQFAEQLLTLTANVESEGVGTASSPVSYGSVCYPSLGSNACVFTEAELVGSVGEFVCNEAQGLEIEAVWNQAMDDPYGPTGQADQAAKLKIEEMRKELRLTLAQSDCD